MRLPQKDLTPPVSRGRIIQITHTHTHTAMDSDKDPDLTESRYRTLRDSVRGDVKLHGESCLGVESEITDG